MDVEDIRALPTVVERRAAAGPSGISAPHCWFCGKIGAVWFQATAGVPGGSTCDCAKSQEARAGRRPKPRWNPRTQCIENLDEETIQLNERLGYKCWVRPAVTPIKPKSATPSEVPTVHVEPIVDSMDTGSSVHATDAVDSTGASAPSSVDSVDRLAARRAYKAEHERQRRAKQKGGP